MSPGRLAAFAAWYLGQFVVANVRVAGHVLRPRLAVRPVVVRLPLRSRSDTDVAAVIALVSLTPGTLVVDRQAEEEGTTLTVHVVHADDPDAEVAQLHELETRLLGALGRGGDHR